ncbi:acyltransferase [Pseudomonas sp. CAN2814]|uniref:acyltransferase family protein n=1 Tax=Pseudomonas sp. CAN1 TaxID=3046726 RepID=UPI002649C0C1|nr:acyltransferase [Pseudomonas sp. CAN1]MDN6855247.1 acyltransferase [Pseudomonas sp. CAN1]
MLGITRFVLAILVLLSHTTGAGFSFNPGIVAVIVFYFTSGYLMQRSYRRFSEHSEHPARTFYLDRVLKLFPQYAVVVIASFAAIAALGPAEHVLFLNQQASLGKVLLNLALLPANYVFAPLVIGPMLPHPIIPPAWSLSSEFHFYLLLPLIFLLPRRGFLALLCLTLSIQVAALFFGSGPFNSDNFGYRFIFGVLTFFLFGYAFSKAHELFYRRIVQTVWVLYVAMLLIVAPAFGLLANPHALEVLLGAVLALPLVYAAITLQPQDLWIKRLDEQLGRLAYPIFISHFLAFFLCEKMLGLQGQSGLAIPAVILTCLIISWLLSALQRGVDRYRLASRGFDSAKRLAEA